MNQQQTEDTGLKYTEGQRWNEKQEGNTAGANQAS